ncbi:restriction endonuclease subunit S [Terasakiella sp.]|uniref:restriction endonuclease subunit S n=1 Tax=Terasakiella sp. TaxID=2034861 RepID=UPI003AA85825
MNKKVSLAAFPRLRFSMFRDTSEWQWHTGNELFDSISNKDHNSDLPVLAITQEQGAVPREQINYHVSVSESSIQNYKIVEIGDFIISLRSFQGGIEYSDYRGLCSPAYIILRKRRDFVSEYFKHYFKSGAYIYALNKNIEGLRDGKMVSYKQFSDISLPLPKLKEEQQKIADCLTSIDASIDGEEEKLQGLQRYKIGLMQQLFPVDGESLPKLRFPEYRDAPEWSLQNGNQLFDPISNKDHDSDLPVLAITQEHGAIPREKINYHVSVSEKSIESYKVVEVGDFIISLRSFQGGIEYSEYKGLCSPAYVILRKRKDFVSEYFKHYFKAGTFIQDLNKNIEGLRDGKMVSYKQFSDLLLPLPPSRDEQQKIANCLTLIDEIIAQQSKKLEALQKQKDGLMQLLFPTDVEMIA